MIEYIDIEELHISVILQRQNRKTLSIMITEQGELLVKAPLTLSEKEIERFLNQKRYWIYKQTKRQLVHIQNRIVRSDEEIGKLRENARQVLTKRTKEFAELLQVEYKKIRIGNQKTRWGSCSSKRTISYNWHLVLMPEIIMDYVVVHELCHLIEMNHSKQFWHLVEQILPDYRERREWLKKNGNQYL